MGNACSFALTRRNPSASNHIHISADWESFFLSWVPPFHRGGQSHILEDSSPGVELRDTKRMGTGEKTCRFLQLSGGSPTCPAATASAM